jgi:hypothetical protein
MANEPIAIDYNRTLDRLEKLLDGVNRPGDFHAFGRLVVPLPRIEIEGVGVLSFPLPPAQAAEIARHAEQAPYGRGEETLVDTSVRKVWQIAPERVRLGGKAWPDTLETLLGKVTTGLGCTGRKVSAEFYKFLLYDQGSFFVAHRDTEKTDGMFGTLVIMLPSEHTGGELIVRHAGREVRFDPGGLDVSELAYAAFYADCQHEVLPITEGSRPCLVFNLVQQSAGKRAPLTAPNYDREIAAAAAILRDTFAASAAPAKLVWLLEHQYSPAALNFSTLKRADAAIAQVLTAAAGQADCVTHLALVHIEETGSAEPEYPYYGRRRSRRWADDDGETAGDFEVIDVFEGYQYLDHWITPEGEPKAFGNIPLEAGELLPAGALDDQPPDAQSLHEATGNEGASYERSYLRAALVLWPRERFADVLLQAGAANVLPHFADRIAACGRDSKARDRVVELAGRIIDAWPAHSFGYSYRRERATPADRREMLRLLIESGDVPNLRRFIDAVVMEQYDGAENEVLVRARSLLPIDAFSELVDKHASGRLAECIGLFLAQVEAADETAPGALRPVAEACVRGLAAKREHDIRSYLSEPAQTVDASLLSRFLDALAALRLDDLRLQAVAHLSADHKRYDPVELLALLLQAQRETHGESVANDPVYLTLWREVAAFLLDRSETPPDDPVDWRQEVEIKPVGEDWRELQDFVRDPDARVHRFRVRKERRQVLHQLINSHDLDMTHVTERKGSPQTLVCTKTRRHYRNRCAQYTRDVAAMILLTKALSPDAAEPVGLRQRLTAAQDAYHNWHPPDDFGE